MHAYISKSTSVDKIYKFIVEKSGSDTMFEGFAVTTMAGMQAREDNRLHHLCLAFGLQRIVQVLCTMYTVAQSPCADLGGLLVQSLQQHSLRYTDLGSGDNDDRSGLSILIVTATSHLFVCCCS